MFGRTACQRCNAKIETGDDFCPSCGCKQPKRDGRSITSRAQSTHSPQESSQQQRDAKQNNGSQIAMGAIVAVMLAAGISYLVTGDIRETNASRPITKEVKPDIVVPRTPAYQPLGVGETIEWSADGSPDEVFRQAGPYLVRLTKKTDGEMAAPLVSVSVGGQEVMLEGAMTSTSYTHDISLFVNRAGAVPVLMLQSYTGGAHCCNSIQLAGYSQGKLAKIDLGSWDGESIEIPKDIDGDGVADFVMRDNGFLYAFASYASSYAPPLILNVINGTVADVSSRKTFRRLYTDMLATAGEDCLSGPTSDTRNGACPAYVAAAARIGLLDKAWKGMLEGYDATTNWALPNGCLKLWADACPSGQEVVFKSYPEALLYFLKDHGYVAKNWLPPEMREFQAEPGDETPVTADENAWDA